MKKVLSVLFVFFMCLLYINQIEAETVDSTAPTVSNVTLDKTSYLPGENMTITVDISDDISGINQMIIAFIKEGETSWDNENSFLLNLIKSDISNGINSYTVKIPGKVEEGNYTFYNLVAIDNAENRQVYEKYSIDPNGIITDFSLPSISIQGTYTGDLESPILTELTFDKTTIEPGETVNVIAKVKDDSEIQQVTLYTKSSSYIMSKIDENTFSTQITLTAPGIYNFKEIQLEDIHGNESIYMYKSRIVDGEYGGCDNYFTLENEKYDIVVKGTVDNTAPVLKKVIVNEKSVKAPSSFFVYVVADDNYSKNLDVSIVLARKDEKSTYATSYFHSKENNKYAFQININQYASPGEYYIVSIYLKDEAGNQVLYDSNPSEFVKAEKLGEYSFTVVEDTSADVVTSTTSSNIIEKIENANEDSYISVDTTKNTVVDKSMFEAIKGTTKTISFETNGVRWIFNGENIVNPKTIDTKTEIYFVDNYKNIGKWDKKNNKALVIKFQDNGELPGKVLIRIKADYAFRDYIGEKKLKLYYMNGDSFDLISKGINVSKDGYYDFYINHNSTYFLTDGSVSEKYVVNDYSEELGNNELNEKIKDGKIIIEEDKIDEIIENPSQEEIKKDTENKETNKNSKNNTKTNLLVGTITTSILLVCIIIIFIVIKRKKKNNEKQKK